MNGWKGRLLVADLSKREVSVQSLVPEIYEKFIGATGLNARLLWQEAPPEVHPLSSENPLILGIGPLVGTPAPSGNRFTATFKSPLTGIYGDANAGGVFAPEVKFAGYDGMILRGRAERPVYLWIRDDQVEIRDAAHLWGKDTWETEAAIQKELGDPDVKTLAIGPAGENLVKFAVLVGTHGRVAGRCGAGCLAGFKNLKAIAVRGTRKVEVSDPAFLKNSFQETAALINRPDNVGAINYRRWGTNSALLVHNTVIGCAAARNFRNNVYEKYSEIAGEAFEKKFKTGNRACFRCPLACDQAWEIREGRFAGEKGEKLELSTTMAFGVVVDNDDLAAICHLQNLCGKLGLDVIELGDTLGMAMECWEKGILTSRDTQGIDLEWGNVESMIELAQRIAQRRGFGDILAEGVRGAAERIGKGAPEYAMHVKGLGMTGEEVKTTQGWALSFAVNVRGGDHLKGSPLFEKIPTPLCREIVRNIFGTEEVADMRSPAAKGRAVWWQENQKAMIDSLGMCSFIPRQSLFLMNRERQFDFLYRLFIAATGSRMDFPAFLRCSERIVQMQRAYNAREGITRTHDTLPQRLRTEEAPSEPGKGLVAQLDHEGMLPEYYSFRGCDQRGLPTAQRLQQVGLEDVARELRTRGKLSTAKDPIRDFDEILRYLT
jgi:aldehyde:ferredoxin oxidoreductase